jgi:hypothetical protein
MDKHRSLADLQVHVTIPGPIVERTIYIDRDAVVDFDEVVRPARPGREALTLRDALSAHVDKFEPVVEAPSVATQDEAQPAMPAAEEVTHHA